MINKIPHHLKKYIVEQNYNDYTAIDQACWKFIMKISISFFKKNADSSYLKGLKKTGVTIDKIPKIKEINKALIKIGWQAVCVRGFIPPHAFMEFQSLRIMPIAADMRSHKNLTYTPSPDIVHEAAGHLPIIVNKDYSNYLSKYGEIAIKALMSNEDLNLYYAIRDLSDIKEKPNSTRYMIKKYEKKLNNAYDNITFTSESALLSRMNWWTVEYGLIKKNNKTNIFGAGLLSSVAESENSLKKNVKKIPLNLNCIKYNYDITEQQPQLFVTPNFKYLSKLLTQLSKKMSFQKGGIYGIKEAYKCNSICTIKLDSSVEISGIIERYIIYKNNISFIKLKGPAQISYNNEQIKGQGPDFHYHGYSCPIGKIKKYNKPISDLTNNQQNNLNLKKNKYIELDFLGGIKLKGKIIKLYKKKSKLILLSLENCLIKKKNEILFMPDWGQFDLICGNNIVSVYNGPADRNNYYKSINENIEEKFNRYNIIKLNKKIKLEMYFEKIENFKNQTNKKEKIKKLYENFKQNNLNDWLFKYQILEILKDENDDWIIKIYKELEKKSLKNNDLGRAIKRGLQLIK